MELRYKDKVLGGSSVSSMDSITLEDVEEMFDQKLGDIDSILDAINGEVAE